MNLDLYQMAVRQARWQLAYGIFGGALFVASFVCFVAHALEVPGMLELGTLSIVAGGVLFAVSNGKGREAAATFKLAQDQLEKGTLSDGR